MREQSGKFHSLPVNFKHIYFQNPMRDNVLLENIFIFNNPKQHAEEKPNTLFKIFQEM